MSDERPDELDRLIPVAEAIDALNALIAAEESLDEVLGRVAQLACDAVPDAYAVSITVLGDPQPRTAAYTDERVLRLDREQYASGRGPCLEAAQSRRSVRVAIDASPQRWPEFVTAARDEGVSATLSVPLILDPVDPVDPADPPEHGELVGSVNVYSRSATAFDPFDEHLMRLYTTTASHAITNARRWHHLRETVGQLERALTSRSEIDQAKGALRVMTGATADEAFGTLVELSQRYNTKLRDVARQLLAEYASALDDQPARQDGPPQT